jgi:hypothetical protein
VSQQDGSIGKNDYDVDFKVELYLYDSIDYDEAIKRIDRYGFEIIEKEEDYFVIGCNKEHFEDVFHTKIERRRIKGNLLEKMGFKDISAHYVWTKSITIPDTLKDFVQSIEITTLCRKYHH